MANGWLKELFYNGIGALLNAGPSAFQSQETTEKRQNND